MNKNIKLLDVINEESLYNSMYACLSNVIWKDSVAHFYINSATEINRLLDEIKSGKYKQRKPHIFNVGKRKILSISFRDRVVERVLDDDIIMPEIEKHLIEENFACRLNKGTDEARNYLKKCLHREYINHDTIYALKCDIKGYYDNISHEVGERCFKKYLPNEIYEFVKNKILSIYPGDKGYIAGNQTVQIIGISALNDLDHFIKEKLKIKSYLRYMDDFILIHHDKKYLEYCKEQIKMKLSEISLELNEEKTRIIDLHKELIEFLGFDFKLTDTGKMLVFVSSHKVKRKRIELQRMANKVLLGKKSRKSADKAYEDYRQHCMYGNVRNFLKRLDKWYYGLYGEDVPKYMLYKRI